MDYVGATCYNRWETAERKRFEMVGAIVIIGVLVAIFVVLLQKELKYHRETKDNCMWRIVPMVGIAMFLAMILMKWTGIMK